MHPKKVCALIPRICEYDALHGERDFVHAIKLRILLGHIILDYSDWANVITRVFIRRGQEVSVRGDVTQKTEFGMVQGHEPRNEESLWKL